MLRASGIEATLDGEQVTVSLPPEESFLGRYPGEVSVGQAQRLLIAMAILHKPSLVIADEPTSALDVVTQADILKLFSRLNHGLKMAVLYISHDLLSVSALCHRVAILHEGEIVAVAGPGGDGRGHVRKPGRGQRIGHLDIEVGTQVQAPEQLADEAVVVDQ